MILLSYALQAASAVASATMTPLNVEFPPNKLLELVAKVCTFCCNFGFIICVFKQRSKNGKYDIRILKN